MYEFIPTKLIAEMLDIPRPTLVKIIQNLSRAGILETKEGKKGGVRLAKAAGDVAILDILHAMEQGRSLFNTSFNIAAVGERPDQVQKSVTGILHHAEESMKQVLAQRTIADLQRD
jgi:Rrf2 family protein